MKHEKFFFTGDTSRASISLERGGSFVEFGCMIYLHKLARIPQMWLTLKRDMTVSFHLSNYKPNC